jgi:stearoyl-CoA desaturase (Delta-9 desaturase)
MDGREHYKFILAVSLLPLCGVLVAIVLLWNTWVGISDIVALVVMYTIAGLGISTGYHRLLAHRSFKTVRPIKLFLTAAGAVAAQGPPLIWTAHHRRHHRVADKPGDPHSPYRNDDASLLGVLKGLWYAHLGWLFNRELTSDPVRYCPDLARDPDMRFISRYFLWFVLAGLVLPAVIGWVLTGTLLGAMTGLLWGGLVRIFVVNHATYAVNSLCHYFGRRRFSTPDESHNIGWLALFSFGEAWHNNHHAFPRSASHGMRWWELDLSAIVIRGLELAGLAKDVIRIDRRKQEEKEAAWAKVGNGRYARSNPALPLAEIGQTAPVGLVDVE